MVPAATWYSFFWHPNSQILLSPHPVSPPSFFQDKVKIIHKYYTLLKRFSRTRKRQNFLAWDPSPSHPSKPWPALQLCPCPELDYILQSCQTTAVRFPPLSFHLGSAPPFKIHLNFRKPSLIRLDALIFYCSPLCLCTPHAASLQLSAYGRVLWGPYIASLNFLNA